MLRPVYFDPGKIVSVDFLVLLLLILPASKDTILKAGKVIILDFYGLRE